MNYIKKVRTRSSTSPSRQSLGVPVPRIRIQSDTAILLLNQKGSRRSNEKPTSARPPLMDLNKNIPKAPTASAKIPQKNVKTNKCSIRSIDSIKCKSRTSISRANKKSAISDRTAVFKEPEVKKTPRTNKSTTNRRLPSQSETVIDNYDADLDKILVDYALHYISFKPPDVFEEELVENKPLFVRALIGGKFTSPIKPNQNRSGQHKNFKIVLDIVEQDSKLLGNLEIVSGEPFITQYLEDIVYSQLKNDQKCVVKKNNLQCYNPCLRVRANVIDWLMHIQDQLDQSPTILFTTIRMFDKVLGSVLVPTDMYPLVGVVIWWIVNKFELTMTVLTTSTMQALCNATYSVQQFLCMEKKLLIFFGFDLNSPDITIYATFYIRKLNIESDLLFSVVYYIFECYTLSINFSTVVPSKLAAAAVCLAVNIFHPLTNVWHILKGIVGCYEKKELDETMQEMLKYVKKMQDPRYIYRRAYLKYATKEKFQASIVLHTLTKGYM